MPNSAEHKDSLFLFYSRHSDPHWLPRAAHSTSRAYHAQHNRAGAQRMQHHRTQWVALQLVFDTSAYGSLRSGERHDEQRRRGYDRAVH
jgi:hypothetical protein